MKNAFKKVLKGFFGWLINFFGTTFTETGNSIQNIQKDPLSNSITLAMMAARIAALIMIVVAFSSFLANNGYMTQIAVIGEGIGQWGRALTLGTLPVYMGGFVPVAWTILLALSFFAINVALFLSEEGFKRALIVFLMLVVFVSVVIYLLFAWGVIYERHVAIDSFETLWLNIEQNQIRWFVPVIYFVVLCLALVSASLLVMRSDLKKQMTQWLSTVLSLYVGLPLLLWITQNLLALAVMVAFLVLVGGILYILFSILYSKLGDSGETAPEGLENDSTAGVSGGQGRRSGRTTGEGYCQNTVEVEPDAKLWKIRSETGDYIQSESPKGETAQVCPSADFDKGKTAIIQDGEQVVYIEWKPK